MQAVAREKFLSRRHGFTLIELSIVLVIISFLVGGIAAFRTYTKNAQLNTLMNESKYYVDAFNQFQLRYTAVPGDFATATSTWAGTANGDGNGIIRAPGTPGNTAERWLAFQHLAMAGLVQGSYTGNPNSFGGAQIALNPSTGDKPNLPASSIGKVAFMFDHPDAVDGGVGAPSPADPLYFDGYYGNILRIAGVNDAYNNIPDVPFLTPKQAYQIDVKYDDGIAGSGMVITPKQSALANCATSNANTAGYNTAFADNACYLFIRMQ